MSWKLSQIINGDRRRSLRRRPTGARTANRGSVLWPFRKNSAAEFVIQVMSQEVLVRFLEARP